MTARTAMFIGALCAGLGMTPAMAWSPDAKLLEAIRFVESSGGLFTRGDRGLSLGDFQLQSGAWQDVSEWRKSRGIKTYNYKNFAMNPSVNRAYAHDYICIIFEQLRAQFRRDPSPAELYAAYNMGLTAFGEKCGYRLTRVNATTASKCRQITEFLEARR